MTFNLQLYALRTGVVNAGISALPDMYPQLLRVHSTTG